jgi:hypothetical protein
MSLAAMLRNAVLISADSEQLPIEKFALGEGSYESY